MKLRFSTTCLVLGLFALAACDLRDREVQRPESSYVAPEYQSQQQILNGENRQLQARDTQVYGNTGDRTSTEEMNERSDRAAGGAVAGGAAGAGAAAGSQRTTEGTGAAPERNDDARSERPGQDEEEALDRREEERTRQEQDEHRSGVQRQESSVIDTRTDFERRQPRMPEETPEDLRDVDPSYIPNTSSDPDRSPR
jgi:hypothetical protein